jgi:hypothetical protein
MPTYLGHRIGKSFDETNKKAMCTSVGDYFLVPPIVKAVTIEGTT